MTFNTRAGARLPQSNLTGLGAVGGPQGVAAGGLRVILEFLTQYDPAAVKQLESDLAQLNTDLANYNSQAARRAQEGIRLQDRIAKAEHRIAEADARNGNTRFKRELAQIRTLAENTTQRAEAQRRLQTLVAEVQASGVPLRARELSDLQRLLTLDRQLGLNKKQRAALQAQINALQQQEVAQQEQLTRFQNLRQGIGGKLGGLAIGAIGATIGGTILAGTVFMAMQAAVEAVGTAIYDNIIDPTHKAREAMAELGQAVNAVEGATDFSKASTYLKQLGIEANEATVALLAQASAASRAQAGIDAYKQIVEASANADALKKKQIEELAGTLQREDEISGNLVQTHERMGYSTALVADKQYYLNLATERYVGLADAAAAAARTEAFNKQALSEANARAAFAQELLNGQIQAGLDRASASYDARIAAVPDASARTQRLEKKIASAQSSGGGGGGASQKANIAEERALILLRMRLRDMGTAINLAKYEGKFRLEAINAKIRALQKEGDAQDRVNRLLKLQYEMSKEVTRQQGESIQDYLERRAQQNRDLLSQRDDLKRESQIAALNEQKERLEDEVKLQELAEKAKQKAIGGTQSAYINSLRKQLEASKKRDKEEAQRRKAALEKERKELVAAANEALKIATAEQTATWRTTLWGMDNIQNLNRVSGQLQGLYRGKGALEALVNSWGVPRWVAAPFLAQINAQIAAYNATKSRLYDKALAGPPGGQRKIPLAEGGIIALRNSSSPFGQNVQFGEAGTEIGVVLSAKVTDQLRRMNFPKNIGPFYMQGSNDPLRDQFTFKRIVKEAVAEALR